MRQCTSTLGPPSMSPQVGFYLHDPWSKLSGCMQAAEWCHKHAQRGAQLACGLLLALSACTLASGAGGNPEMRTGPLPPPGGPCNDSAPWCAVQSGFAPSVEQVRCAARDLRS